MGFRHALLIAGLVGYPATAQLLIQEVRPSKGDRAVLINGGREPLDLCGTGLLLRTQLHRIDSSWTLPAGGRCELRFRGEDAQGATEVPFKLPRTGGTLLLLASDGATVLDAFNWSALGPGAALHRMFEGATSTVLVPADPPGPGVVIHLVAGGELQLNVDPADLWDPASGIDVGGTAANYAREGPDWQRPARIGVDNGPFSDAVIRIAGSGSRSLEKRSFHVRMGDGQAVVPGDSCGTLTLRADAPPNAFLRNVFIEAVVHRARCAVDVQPSVPVRLLINGEYHGLYRAMPKKDPAWLARKAGARKVDVLAGPGLDPSRGGRSDFDRALGQLRNGASCDTLSASIDLESLMDLSILDVYTGRADHDLNVRCWRPRCDTGRWRWIVYDMDLWTTEQENSLERMVSGAEHEAPYLRSVLKNEELRNRWSRRAVALLNTALSPVEATALVDSLTRNWGPLMIEDHERWKGALPRPAVEEGAAELRSFVAHRPAVLLGQLAAMLGGEMDSVQVRCEPMGAGWITLEGLPLTHDQRAVQAPGSIPLKLFANAAPGYEFVGWQGDAPAKSPEIVINAGDVERATAIFRPVAWSSGNGLQQATEQP